MRGASAFKPVSLTRRGMACSPQVRAARKAVIDSKPDLLGLRGPVVGREGDSNGGRVVQQRASAHD